MPKNKRPTSVTLLALFILGLALWNGLRLLQAIAFWSILKEYQADPGPFYTATSSSAWFLAGLFIVWGLWQGKAWAWFSALGGMLGYGFWYWFDRLVLQEPHPNGPFALASTIILISFLGILFRHSAIVFFFHNAPSALRFFQFRNNNKKNPNVK